MGTAVITVIYGKKSKYLMQRNIKEKLKKKWYGCQ